MAAVVPPIKIAKPSLQSLFIETYFNNTRLASGTGFVCYARRGPVLITNRHNVTGRHQDTGQPLNSTNGGVPNRILIHHRILANLDLTAPAYEALYSDSDPYGGNHLWIEHPTMGAQADFVALPLTETYGRQLLAYDPLQPGPAIHIGVADPVSVIGFPFGIRSGGTLPVWATGFIATEPNVNHDNLPKILIDCRARRGQSGSAVISYRHGSTVPMEDGSQVMFSLPAWRFIGIYSGRINSESDLGIVWKASAIAELLRAI